MDFRILPQGQLYSQASDMGANAVVGVVASGFGAGGGITGILGGDAVGVLLVGGESMA